MIDEFFVIVYVGGVNAISGELTVVSAKEHFKTKRIPISSAQDYIVIPAQSRLDGIVMERGTLGERGKVRQFVAMLMGVGYTVEAQISGKEITGGLQFEITPLSHTVKP